MGEVAALAAMNEEDESCRTNRPDIDNDDDDDHGVDDRLH